MKKKRLLAISVLSAWSGGTVDTTRNRLLVWGGHNDHWSHEMDALELEAQ